MDYAPQDERFDRLNDPDWKEETPSQPLLAPHLIYDKHEPTVQKWARRLGGPLIDPDDIVHDVFLVVLKKHQAFRGDAKITTWLYRITERVAKVHRRRAQRRLLLRMRAKDYMQSPSDGVESPTAQFDRKREIEMLYAALERLDDNLRSTFVLYYLDELSAQIVASLTGVDPSTVWVRLHRGRKKMQATLRRAGVRDAHGCMGRC